MNNKPTANALLFSALILVIIGTYISWEPFGPLYDGPRPTSVGGIEFGYQWLDVPILVPVLLAAVHSIWNRGRNVSHVYVIPSAVVSLLFTLYHSVYAGAGLFALRWGYYVTILGAIFLAAAGVIQRYAHQ